MYVIFVYMLLFDFFLILQIYFGYVLSCTILIFLLNFLRYEHIKNWKYNFLCYIHLNFNSLFIFLKKKLISQTQNIILYEMPDLQRKS